MTTQKNSGDQTRSSGSEKASTPKNTTNNTRAVRDIMSKNLRLTNEDATIADARKAMRDNNIRHLLVVDVTSGALKGVLSDRDVRAILSPFVGTPGATDRDNATLGVRVKGIMKQPPFVATGDEPVRKAVETMLQKKVGCLPVVDEQNKPVGIITTDDLLREMLNLLS